MRPVLSFYKWRNSYKECKDYSRVTAPLWLRVKGKPEWLTTFRFSQWDPNFWFFWWCHPTISSSAAPFSSCPQSFPMSWLFESGGQSIGASASASVLPINIHSWFSLGLTGFISLQSNGLSRVFSSTTVWKHQFFSTQPSLWPTLTSVHYYWKNHTFD